MTEREANASPKDAALKLALEALEYPGNIWHMNCPRNESITAIKEALAHPEQEPVAFDVKCDACKGSGLDWDDNNYKCVACHGSGFVEKLLYATPQKCKPLTDEQIEMLQFLDGSRPLDGVWFGEEHPKQQGEYWWRKHLHRAFDEAAHGIKENT